MDKTSRSRVGMWIVAAAAVAVVGCRLGQADDAPGLGGLSLFLALAMVLHAFIIAGVLSRKCARLVGTGVVGVLCIIAPFVLYMDGEIAVLSPFWLLFPLGVVFLIMLIKQLKQ